MRSGRKNVGLRLVAATSAHAELRPCAWPPSLRTLISPPSHTHRPGRPCARPSYPQLARPVVALDQPKDSTCRSDPSRFLRRRRPSACLPSTDAVPPVPRVVRRRGRPRPSGLPRPPAARQHKGAARLFASSASASSPPIAHELTPAARPALRLPPARSPSRCRPSSSSCPSPGGCSSRACRT